MKINKNWIILIYVLILINLALVMAVVVLNNANILSDNSIYQSLERDFNQKITSKWNSFIKYQLSLNSDWSWFVDLLNCPDNVTMSWNTNMWNFTSILTYSWSSFFCSWSYNFNPVNIFYNTGFTWFIAASYQWVTIWLNEISWWMEWSTKFIDTDQTFMSFQDTSYLSWDSIDDNFNSDDYKSSSTWDIEYLSPYLDNDDLWRKEVFWYITSTGIYENIFWNNFETNAFILANQNNTGTLNKNVWDIYSGSLFIDVDKNFSLKIVRFDRNYYTKFSREMIALETFTSSWYLLAWSWYIQIINGVLSLTWGIDLNTTFFNFKHNDYAVFLSNESTSWVLYYKMSWKDLLYKNIYLNPINDSYTDKIKYLWNHIITSSWNVYIWKQFEVFWLK